IVCGPQEANVRTVVAAAADQAALTAFVVAAADLPPDPADRERMLRRMERETVLGRCAWVLDVGGVRPEEAAMAFRAFVGLDAPAALLGTAADGSAPGAADPADAVRLLVERLPLDERRVALASAAHRAGAALEPTEVDTVAGVFDLALDHLEH